MDNLDKRRNNFFSQITINLHNCIACRLYYTERVLFYTIMKYLNSYDMWGKLI